MVMCFAPDCKHYSERDKCRFFVFPKDVKEKKTWCKLLRREDKEPTKYSLVCSCHFVNGDRNNRPTIFDHNKEKALKISPEEKKRRFKSPIKKVLSHTVSVEPELSALKKEDICLQSTSKVAKDADSNAKQLDSKPSTSKVASNEEEVDSRPTSSTSILAENLATLDINLTPSPTQFVSILEAENYFLKQQVLQQQEALNKLSLCMSWEHIENDDKRILMYTGMPNKEIFMALYNLMKNLKFKYYYGWSVIGVTKLNQLLLTLMKLRLNLHHEDLACRFNISRTTVSNILYTWIHALHEVVFEQLMQEIPSRSKNKLCAPTAFISFSNCRIIIDCTEISAISPKSMKKQQLTYSSYKHRNTLKGLIGVAPNGVYTFASKLYPGSTSDKKLFEHCELNKKLVPGDLVIADKGFLIADLLPHGVQLNIPPFLTTPQFTEEQVLQTQKIARARIHVERAIRRIKCFDILNKVAIPQSSYLFQVCGALTNFQFPLIKEVEHLFCKNDDI